MPEFPTQSPLFHAGQADRYARQEIIRDYQSAFDCRLVVMMDDIFPDGIAFFEELVWNADPDGDLHLMLVSPGGDGETAVRLVRSAQERCKELTIIVPDQAKSAATLMCLGAHHILMGPTSDLGPVDPQYRIGERQELVSAKAMIAAVERAAEQVDSHPATDAFYASLLTDISMIKVEQARSELERTDDLLREALSSVPDRTSEQVDALAESLKEPLVEAPRSHAAIFGADDAIKAGLPVQKTDPKGDQWQMIWRLYAKYFDIASQGPVLIYEGASASQIRRMSPMPPFHLGGPGPAKVEQ